MTPYARPSPVPLLLLVSSLSVSCGPTRQEPEERTGNGFSFEPVVATAEPPEQLQVELGPEGLEIDPGRSSEITIQVSPAGVYPVTLAIVGQTNGAFLDRDRVETDDAGRATTRLTVPSEASELVIQASVLGKRAELVVEVGRALATVIVEPAYVGAREVDDWVASIITDGSACPDANKYDVGGDTFPVGEPIVFDGVPATRPVQVFARGRQYLFGCAPDMALQPGVPNVVAISVSNRPIQLASVNMSIRLSFTRTVELDGALDQLLEQMLLAFRAGQSDDATALLTAMAEVYALREPDFGKPRFELAVVEHGWTTTTANYLSALSETPNPVSEIASTWLTAGRDSLFSATGFVTGTLISGDGDGALETELGLAGVGPLDPEVLSLAGGRPVVLTATSNDNVSAGFSLGLRPSRLLAALADEASAAESLAGVPHLLSTTLDCVELADELVARSPDTEEPLPNCTPSCLRQLCDDGLSWMWAQGRQLGRPDPLLEVQAQGPAALDAQARPQGFAGTWRGQWELLPGVAVSLEGPFSAANQD